MSPDGRLLAGGVQHGEYPEHTVEDIRIRRTEDGSVIRMIDTAKDTGWPVWSPDGELIAALTPDAIQVVRVRDGRLLTSIEGYPPLAEDPVPIVLSPDGRFLAMKGERGGIALWDVTSGRYLRTLEGDFESGISFSPDGRLFAEGGTPVKLRSTPDGSVVRKLRSGEPAGSVYASSVLAVAFFPDGRHIASHGSDETVRVWPVEDYGLEDER